MLNKCLAVWACLVLLGCTSGGSENERVRLSWRFVDGRACDLAGVVDVTVVESSNRLKSFIRVGLFRGSLGHTLPVQS